MFNKIIHLQNCGKVLKCMDKCSKRLLYKRNAECTCTPKHTAMQRRQIHEAGELIHKKEKNYVKK